MDEIQINNNYLLIEQGKIQRDIEQFEADEKKILNRLNISISRNLLGDYSNDDILKIKSTFEENEVNINKNIKRKQEKIQTNNDRITKLDNEKSCLECEINKVNIEIENIKTEIELYKKQENKAIKALLLFEINETELFNKKENEIIIKSMEKKYRKESDNYKFNLNNKMQYIDAIKSGFVHTSSIFSAILDENKIAYETGEKYLAEETEKRRSQLLKSNPMLPYCYIVDKKDYERIKKLEINETVRQLIPIITFDEIQ